MWCFSKELFRSKGSKGGLNCALLKVGWKCYFCPSVSKHSLWCIAGLSCSEQGPLMLWGRRLCGIHSLAGSLLPLWHLKHRIQKQKIRTAKYFRNEVGSFVEYTRWPGSLLRECEVYFLFGELAKRKRARLQSPLTHSGWRRCYHNIVFPSNKTTHFHHHHQFCKYLSIKCWQPHAF